MASENISTNNWTPTTSFTSKKPSCGLHMANMAAYKFSLDGAI
jgi:hypothetical protein